MESVECLVVGAGVIGLAVARALALAGREVTVVERETGLSVLCLRRIGAGFPNRRDIQPCWLGGGQQECLTRIRKTCVTA